MIVISWGSIPVSSYEPGTANDTEGTRIRRAVFSRISEERGKPAEKEKENLKTRKNCPLPVNVIY